MPRIIGDFPPSIVGNLLRSLRGMLFNFCQAHQRPSATEKLITSTFRGVLSDVICSIAVRFSISSEKCLKFDPHDLLLIA